jgi:hypothetical protein
MTAAFLIFFKPKIFAQQNNKLFTNINPNEEKKDEICKH